MTGMRMRFLLISDTHGKLGIIDDWPLMFNPTRERYGVLYSNKK